MQAAARDLLQWACLQPYADACLGSSALICTWLLEREKVSGR
jgi:hypothetical protein